MKKYLKTSLILFIALFGVKVKADVSAPSVPTLNFYVSNPEGAYKYKYDRDKEEYYKTDEKINYNEKIDLICFDEDSEYCGYMFDSIIDRCEIKRDDVTLIKDKFTKDDGIKLDKKIYVKVFNKNGVDLYNGPSTTFYKKIGTIPYGTEFSYEYVDVEGHYGWIYVSYGDLSGWVYYGIVDGDENEMAILQNINLIIINNNYFMIDNIDGLFEIYFRQIDRTQRDNFLEKKRVNVDIPYGTLLKSKYAYRLGSTSYYLIQYDGEEYWIRDDRYKDCGFAVTRSHGEYSNIGKLLVDRDLYDSINNGNIIGHISAGDSVKVLYEHFLFPSIHDYYVEYNGLKGWIIECDELGVDGCKLEQVNKDEISKTIEEKAKEKSAKKVEKKNNKNIIIYCIFGAIALAITALTIIILKNKKQKKSVIKIENEKSIENIEEKESEIKSNGISESEYNKEENIENKDEKKL